MIGDDVEITIVDVRETRSGWESRPEAHPGSPQGDLAPSSEKRPRSRGGGQTNPVSETPEKRRSGPQEKHETGHSSQEKE